MNERAAYKMRRGARAGALACAFACMCALLAGCAADGGLPAPVESVLSVVLPHGAVDEGDVPDLSLPDISGDDREVGGSILALERPVLITIHVFEDAISAIAEVEETDEGPTLIGTFVLDDADRAAIMRVVDGWAASGRDCGFLLLDLSTGAGLAYHIDTEFYTASAIKGINLCAISYYEPGVWQNFYGDIRAALVDSDNESYETVFNEYSDYIPNQWRHRAHLGNQRTGRMYTNLTPREFAQLWCVNWDYLSRDNDVARTLTDFMSRTYRSAFVSELGGRAGYAVCSKAGWEGSTHPTTCCEGGYITTSAGQYLLVIMTDRAGYPDETLSPLVDALDRAWWDYVPRRAKQY